MMQKISNTRKPPQWLTLSEAAEHLGVHPTTMRRWANENEVRCVRTPGGHRRFRRQDLQAFLEARTETAQAPLPEGLTQSAVRHTRGHLSSAETGDVPWMEIFSESERAHRRESGRRLVGLAIQFASRSNGQEAILNQAREIGEVYGRDAAERGLSLVELTRAFLFFGRAMMSAIRPGGSRAGQYDEQDVHIHRSLRAFLDDVMVASMAAYEQALPTTGLLSGETV